MTCPNLTVRCLALMLLLASAVARGQGKQDSLLHVYNSGKADATTFNELIWAYVFNQPDSAIFYGHRGLGWIAQNREDSLLGSIRNRIGVAYDIKSMPDSALHWYALALEHALSSGNRKTEAGALNNIGLIYWNRGQADKAIDHYIRAASIFEELGNDMGLANAYNNIALILHDDEQDERSLRYNRQALAVRLRIGHTYGVAASYANIAQIYLFADEPVLDSAEHYINLAIPLKQQLKDSYGLARAYNSLADVFLARQQYDSALAYFHRTLNIQKSIDNAEGYASTFYNIAAVYRKMNLDRPMLAFLDSAQAVAEMQQDVSLLWKIYAAKAKTLSRLGRYQEAYPYWMRYETIKDSLLNIERSSKIAELETRYRTAEQERELSEKKAALAEAKLKVENRTKWIIGLLSGLLVLTVLGFAMLQRSKRRSQAEKDAAIIAERERGLEAIIEATEEERKRIAKDLHDGVVQSLTGVSLRLQRVFGHIKGISPKEMDEATASKAMLNDAISELRTISHQMMPRVLSEQGLVPAMDDMLQKTLGSTTIKYEFEHHKVDGQRYAENVEVSLYRICQELINNIIKHSDAKAVSVQLLQTSSHLVLVVEDNGKGFNFEDVANRNGIGLMNISSRAKAIRGEVNYQPSPEQGTVATVRVPIA